MIVVYAQWVKLGPEDGSEFEWLTQFDGDIGLMHMNKGIQWGPMSEMVQNWLFHDKREFDKQYVKRLYGTNSDDLSTNGWVDWMTKHINDICAPDNGLWVSIQMQATPDGAFAANGG